MQSKKNGLAGKLGSRLDKAVKKHAGDKTNYGRVDLPPGIKGGVARIVSCKFDTYKTGKLEGEYYFQARGAVVEPRAFEYKGRDIDLSGAQTMIQIPVCDLPDRKKTVEDQVEVVLNEMRKLGMDTEGVGGDELEGLAEAIAEAKPYFKFSTSPRVNQQTKEEDGIWENWHGNKGLEDYEEPEGPDDVTEENEEELEEKAPAPKNPKAKGPTAPPPPRKPAKAKEPEPEDEGEVFQDDAEDLDALAEEADGDNKKKATAAVVKLTELAVKAGYTAEEADEAAGWAEVVEMIRNPKTADKKKGPKKPPVPKQKGEDAPEVGGKYLFTVEVMNKKTKKMVEKEVEVEVTSVDEDEKTASVIDDEGTEYDDVSFDDLKPVEE